MKPFQIMRYINKLKIFIMIFCVVGCFLFNQSVQKKQTYLAQTVLRYSDATNVNIQDINSTSVLNRAIERSGMGGSVEFLRSHLSIGELIPSEEKTKISVALEAGKDYEYIPTDYKLTYSVDSNYSLEYVIRTLTAIVDAYFEWYSENRVQTSMVPTRVTDLQHNGMDYLEQADQLESFLEDMIKFLSEKASANADYRSAKTGYSFLDFQREFEYLNDNALPYIYSDILDYCLTNDPEVLIKKYEKNLDDWRVKIQSAQQKVDSIQAVIQSYADKNKEGQLYYNSTASGTNAQESDASLDSNILSNVYGEWNGKSSPVDRTTTYDILINDYTNYKIQLQQYTRMYEQISEYLTIFRSGTDADEAIRIEAKERVTRRISTMLDTINALYKEVNTTVYEHLDYLTTQRVQMMTSVYSKAGTNTTMYLLLSLVLFVVIGCGGAVVIGRIFDFANYFLFIDPKFGISNRKACDEYIYNYESKNVSADFSVMVVQLRNLIDINAKLGRDNGDKALKEIAATLKQIFSAYGFVGYNGNEVFLVFIDHMGYAEMLNNVKMFARIMAEKSGAVSGEVSWKIATGIANSAKSEQYNLRKLMGAAFEQMNSARG